MNIFKKNKTRLAEDSNTISCFIIYTDGKHHISELCVHNIDLQKSNILIPNIGETFIDRQNGSAVEYEVKDIVRTFDGKEYGVQVQLRKRDVRKYS